MVSLCSNLLYVKSISKDLKTSFTPFSNLFSFRIITTMNYMRSSALLGGNYFSTAEADMGRGIIGKGLFRAGIVLHCTGLGQFRRKK